MMENKVINHLAIFSIVSHDKRLIYLFSLIGFFSFLTQLHRKIKKIKTVVLDVLGWTFRMSTVQCTLEKNRMCEALNVWAHPNITLCFEACLLEVCVRPPNFRKYSLCVFWCVLARKMQLQSFLPDLRRPGHQRGCFYKWGI